MLVFLTSQTHCRLPALRHTRRPFCLWLGIILNSKTDSTKLKNANGGTKQDHEMLLALEMKQKDKKVAPCLISVKKREPSYTVGGNVNLCSHHGERYGGSLKAKNIIII